MGTISHGFQTLIQDLKVTLLTSSIVYPSEKTERKFMFLSNIDQALQFNVETIDFFQANPDFPPENVAGELKKSLERVLVSYDFLAGRFRLDPQKGRLEIDCNSAGVGFSVAKSELSLEEIGDLVYPNPAFRQLIIGKLDLFEPEDQPLCIFQLTSFKCGGFSIAISANHATLDGIAFKNFLKNLASMASNETLAIPPYNNRQLLAARSPPRLTFPHPELLKFETQQSHFQQQPPTIFDNSSENLDFKIFQLTADNISDLKEKAKMNNSDQSTVLHITSFNVVVAHIWRCKALVGNVDQNKTCTMLYAVDLRSRLRPPLPPSYTGNAVLAAYATATYRELEEGSLSQLVEMVAQGAARMTDEYARSIIDWNEFYKGVPHGDVLVSSWWKLGFAEVEYPWGRPKYSCPVVCQKKDIILLFPDIEGVRGKGVNILVALPGEEMIRFEENFNKYLP